MTRPPIPMPMRPLPHARRPLIVEQHVQRFTAVCPHGVDVEWVGIRNDTRARILCPCTCPDRAEDAMPKGYRPHVMSEPLTCAPVSPYGPQGAGIVIPLPAEESA